MRRTRFAMQVAYMGWKIAIMPPLFNLVQLLCRAAWHGKVLRCRHDLHPCLSAGPNCLGSDLPLDDLILPHFLSPANKSSFPCQSLGNSTLHPRPLHRPRPHSRHHRQQHLQSHLILQWSSIPLISSRHHNESPTYALGTGHDSVGES